VTRSPKTLLWLALPLLVVIVGAGMVLNRWNTGHVAAASSPRVEYRAGQVWAIVTPPDQPDARLTVLKVDTHERLGRVIHISLSGVELPNGSRIVPHMPLTEAAMAQTVTKLIREDEPVTADVEGYRQWRKAVEAGKGGAFSIPVAQSFETVREAYANQPR
jgi:hypothetical protein